MGGREYLRIAMERDIAWSLNLGGGNIEDNSFGLTCLLCGGSVAGWGDRTANVSLGYDERAQCVEENNRDRSYGAVCGPSGGEDHRLLGNPA